MAKKTVQIADKPTLDEVKQSVDLIKKDISSISIGYDMKSKFDTSLNFYSIDNKEKQTMILAGDYIIKFYGGTNATGNERLYVYSDRYLLISIYNLKTNETKKQFIPYQSYGIDKIMAKLHSFASLISSRYSYDKTTDEVTMWGFGWRSPTNKNTNLSFRMARFKVSELINENFIDNLVIGYNDTQTSVNNSYTSDYKFDISHCIYIPSRNKAIANYKKSTDTNYIVIFDCSDITNITSKVAYVKRSSDTDYVSYSPLSPIRYWYDGTNAYLEYLTSISGTHTQNNTYCSVQSKRSKFLIDFGNSTATAQQVELVENTITVPSISYGLLSNTVTNLWYKGNEFAIVGNVLVKVSYLGLVSEPIIYFPFSPECWNIEDDILVVYGLDENQYLVKYEYDMRNMEPKMNLFAEEEAYRQYTELFY